MNIKKTEKENKLEDLYARGYRHSNLPKKKWTTVVESNTCVREIILDKQCELEQCGMNKRKCPNFVSKERADDQKNP